VSSTLRDLVNGFGDRGVVSSRVRRASGVCSPSRRNGLPHGLKGWGFVALVN
jgi:hypothetical protein